MRRYVQEEVLFSTNLLSIPLLFIPMVGTQEIWSAWKSGLEVYLAFSLYMHTSSIHYTYLQHCLGFNITSESSGKQINPHIAEQFIYNFVAYLSSLCFLRNLELSLK